MSSSALTSAPDQDLLSQAKQKFNEYVEGSMLDEHKIRCWSVQGGGELVLPVIAQAVGNDHLKTARQEVRKEAKSQFNCQQCGINCCNLVSLFGKDGPVLCSYAHEASRTTWAWELLPIAHALYSIAQKLYKNTIDDPTKFTLRLATDNLLTKNKYSYVDPRRPVPTGDTLLHYSGNCDTLSGDIKDQPRNIILKDSACKKYWPLMHNLLLKLTADWGSAGMRHATKQRIRTIQELCEEVTYAKDHFGTTLGWITNILDLFSIPFCRLPMNERIEIAATAICTGNINYDGNGKDGVVHYQYAQMNNTVMMWMKKATSISALKTMMADLCGPKKGQSDPNKPVSAQRIKQAASMLGDDFTTTIATARSLAEYYKDYSGPACFWQAPVLVRTQKRHSQNYTMRQYLARAAKVS